MKRLRVVHLISGDLWAGAEVATYHLVCALDARADVEVSVVVLNPGELADRLRAREVSVSVLAEGELSFAQMLRAIREWVRHADLVHAHRYKENLLAALSGRPWVSTRHGRPEPETKGRLTWNRITRSLDYLALRTSAREVIAVSSEVEHFIRKQVGKGAGIRAWNGIEDPAKHIGMIPWKERPLRVGVLGRLAPVKRFELAIDAVAACPELELEIVGDGPERDALARRIESLGVADRVRLVGHTPDPLGYVSSWRALLVTSLHEGNPISVLEALALGTPVCSVPLRGVAEILDGQGGWIVDSASPAALARTLEQTIYAPTIGESESQAARERYLSTFTAEVAAERMLGIYRSALRPHSA